MAKNKLFHKDYIKNYRKNIKIYDIFIFFNELDLLEIRMNILDKYVDYFVIVEATKTFKGEHKELFFQKNKNRFEKFAKKIIYYIVDDMPESRSELENILKNKIKNDTQRKIIIDTLTTDNIPKNETHWLREFYQKKSIKKAITHLKDDDFCFISDIDEIWNPKASIDYSKNIVYKFKQKMYIYFLNNRSSEKWEGTIATKYKNIKNNSINHLDTPKKPNINILTMAVGTSHFKEGLKK